MNKARRKKTEECLNRVEAVKGEIESILYDEQWAFDSMPEGLKASMRGIDSEEAIGHLEDAMNSLDDAIAALQEI